jgi:hypothetical protein
MEEGRGPWLHRKIFQSRPSWDRLAHYKNLGAGHRRLRGLAIMLPCWPKWPFGEIKWPKPTITRAIANWLCRNKEPEPNEQAPPGRSWHRRRRLAPGPGRRESCDAREKAGDQRVPVPASRTPQKHWRPKANKTKSVGRSVLHAPAPADEKTVRRYQTRFYHHSAELVASEASTRVSCARPSRPSFVNRPSRFASRYFVLYCR